MKILAVLLLISVVGACGDESNDEGRDITNSFLRKYSGEFVNVEDGRTEEMVVSKDGSLVTRWTRQVGTEGDKNLPYPTTCDYVQYGKITQAIERSQGYRKLYQEHIPYLLRVSIFRIEVNSRSSDVNCKNFAVQKQRGSYSYYVELISENHIRLHNSGGGDYSGQGTRTPSTLDENFFRKGSKVLQEAMQKQTGQPKE